jgi:hypothetical protein
MDGGHMMASKWQGKSTKYTTFAHLYPSLLDGSLKVMNRRSTLVGIVGVTREYGPFWCEKCRNRPIRINLHTHYRIPVSILLTSHHPRPGLPSHLSRAREGLWDSPPTAAGSTWRPIPAPTHPRLSASLAASVEVSETVSV